MNLSEFPALIYPPVTIKIRTTEKKEYVFFDTFRKKWIALKPEEYVRNQLLYYLVTGKQYPVGLLSVEKEIKLFNTRKRYDAVFFDTQRNPLVLIECKSWQVVLKEEEVMQLWRYNLQMQSPYLILSNGLHHFFASASGIYQEIPSWERIQKKEL